MTDTDEHAASPPRTNASFFEVTKIRTGADNQVCDVLWSEIDSSSDQDLCGRTLATVAEVVAAIRRGTRVTAAFTTLANPDPEGFAERTFVVVDLGDGRTSINLAGAPMDGRNLADMDRLDA
jgi:hypothetical protein